MRSTVFRAGAVRRYIEQRERPALPRFLFTRGLPRRVPVLLQMSRTECGAACLAMVLTSFGRPTGVAACREACGAGRDGASAETLLQAARAHGLRAKAYSIEPADFRHVPLPAIVHWNFNHFVVVEGWSPRRVTIVDPASGRRRLTAAEFDAGFTGVVLVLEPGAHFQPGTAAERRSLSGYFRSLLRIPGARRLLVLVLGASLVLQLLGLALPLLTAILIDHVLRYQATHLMPVLGAGMAMLVLTRVTTDYLRAALLIDLQRRLDARLMPGFFEHLLALPFRFFAQRSSGDLLLRLGSNATLRELLTGETLAAVLDGTLVIIYLTALALRDPLFGLLVLGIAAMHAALLFGPRRRMRDLAQRHLVAQAASQSYLFEALSGIATLKASGAEDRAMDRWSGLFAAELEVGVQRSRLAAVLDSGWSALATLSPLLLLWAGAQRVLDGSLSLGTMLALTALAGSALTALSSLMANGERLYLAGAHLERLDDVFQAQPEQDPATVERAPQLQGRIELRAVGFRYGAGPWVLHDIRLTIEPGQKVALVGASGSGKSTLGRLLLGLFEPEQGDVLYDGVPLRQMEYRSLRRQFGVVLQEPVLFSGTIRHTIAFHAPDLPLAAVRSAARTAAIDAEIERMPMGYETVVGEGGGGLSGGQVQRIALARALAARPAVLLLDEATSHLDAVTERRVDDNLSTLACTRIVIAHRLSTIRNADLIVVLDQGRIVERGTHDALIARAGRYADLVRGQTAGDACAADPDRWSPAMSVPAGAGAGSGGYRRAHPLLPEGERDRADAEEDHGDVEDDADQR